MTVAWQGVFPAVTTKFREDLGLDHDAMRRHFTRMLDAGCDGLITTGSLGESSTLTIEEKLDILALAREVAGDRVPVIATVAQTTTADAVRFVREGAERGADGFMVLPGLIYVSDRREALAHYRTVASATDLPIMVYNNPVSYRVDIDLDAMAELAELPNVVAIKESSDDVRRVTRIKARFGDRFTIFSGVDNLALESFFMGAEGWVAGLVDAFPEETVAIWRLFRAGRYDEAIAIYRWFSPLLELDVSTRLVQNIKLAEAMTGLGNEIVRPPRLPLAGEERARVAKIIADAIACRPALPDLGAVRSAARA